MEPNSDDPNIPTYKTRVCHILEFTDIENSTSYNCFEAVNDHGIPIMDVPLVLYSTEPIELEEDDGGLTNDQQVTFTIHRSPREPTRYSATVYLGPPDNRRNDCCVVSIPGLVHLIRQQNGSFEVKRIINSVNSVQWIINYI
ncbi:hypothetical protein HUG17_0642 [Dermatophagoides farinae]|uniref:Uncharacterized protein n=1 Tax=Dermatophagoides farinae TaxID=6954 RepID=A0A9D4P6E7_DERFA|nr:hypothetical protein HUG17_0642 [Dermatophagoides farinae]